MLVFIAVPKKSSQLIFFLGKQKQFSTQRILQKRGLTRSGNLVKKILVGEEWQIIFFPQTSEIVPGWSAFLNAKRLWNFFTVFFSGFCEYNIFFTLSLFRNNFFSPMNWNTFCIIILITVHYIHCHCIRQGKTQNKTFYVRRVRQVFSRIYIEVKSY